MSKIQFWKQFTTQQLDGNIQSELYSICQRYNFESNLQLPDLMLFAPLSCIRYVKDTILKAIYNQEKYNMYLSKAVFDMSKIQFWKQFTTSFDCAVSITPLYSICQRYNFESNLQRLTFKSMQNRGCIRYVKDTILKAIYNHSVIIGISKKLYSICQRYNFESNLQQSMWFCTLKFAVFDMSKIQFWKQFTTCVLWNILVFLLYSICQRYNFESNLQPKIINIPKFAGCIRYVKDTILKAIYNWTLFAHARPRAVFDMSKIQY